jgi:hypothetical protein
MKNALFAFVLAGILTVPPIPSALGSDSGVETNTAPPAASPSSSWKDLRLPRAPSPDLMPWLSPGWLWSEPQIDSTWRPDLNRIQPFELAPPPPKDEFSRTSIKSVVRSSSSS